MIETVLGPVQAAGVGRVNMHQHLLSDATALCRPGAEPTPTDEKVTVYNLGFLRWNALALADNLRLDNPQLAVTELRHAAGAIDLVVEDTSVGLGPNHPALPAISRAAGVHVAAAYGLYVTSTLPGWARELDEDGVYEHLLGALTDRIPGVDYRAALLGIMGTTAGFPSVERARLRGAAAAAGQSGASVSVRLDGEARTGVEVVAELVGAGLPADRILLTNADEYLDAAYWHDLLDAGVTLEMCFGTEMQHVGRMRNPSDGQRLDFFESFLAARPDGRWVLGGSVWTKSQLRRYGGEGYDHLTTRVLPELIRRGVAADRLAAMVTREPLRLLDRPPHPLTTTPVEETS
ncbi:phosphotriesterase [Micromonospora endophytica]|uniref:Phosphotriesterase n=1 Tax=Micromonospora endophytica TaxID=515350 RepID=A0A2W2CM54_9ACTN|nr:phosphotriesterase [Micromonospora endophytica]PZF99040.1 phosphotriesterase [Micromonospora endophytica]RIW51504.1 phosphotriesterase [Micromonospora endophytica]